MAIVARPPQRAYGRVAALPDQCRTLEEAYRLRHWDLPDLPEYELWRERRIILARLDREQQFSPWFVERLRAIRSELNQRRRAA